jgi:hypothetical protein
MMLVLAASGHNTLFAFLPCCGIAFHVRRCSRTKPDKRTAPRSSHYRGPHHHRLIVGRRLLPLYATQPAGRSGAGIGGIRFINEASIFGDDLVHRHTVPNEYRQLHPRSLSAYLAQHHSVPARRAVCKTCSIPNPIYRSSRRPARCDFQGLLEQACAVRAEGGAKEA